MKIAACDALQVNNTDMFDGTTIKLVISDPVSLFFFQKTPILLLVSRTCCHNLVKW